LAAVLHINKRNAVSNSKRLYTPDLEVLEYSGIFISNPEYQIICQNNLVVSKMSWCAQV